MERARKINGELYIHSQPHKGTKITLTLPIPKIREGIKESVLDLANKLES